MTKILTEKQIEEIQARAEKFFHLSDTKSNIISTYIPALIESHKLQSEVIKEKDSYIDENQTLKRRINNDLVETKREFLRERKENEALRKRVEDLKKAIVQVVCPLEALRLCEEEKPLLGPKMRKHIIEATEVARKAVL